MLNTRRILTASCLLFLSAAPLVADTVTATGIIEAVDAEAGTITVRRKAGKAEKSARFKIDRDTKVLFEGDSSGLQWFKVGQKVDVVYDTVAKRVIKLEAWPSRENAVPPDHDQTLTFYDLSLSVAADGQGKLLIDSHPPREGLRVSPAMDQTPVATSAFGGALAYHAPGDRLTVVHDFARFKSLDELKPKRLGEGYAKSFDERIRIADSDGGALLMDPRSKAVALVWPYEIEVPADLQISFPGWSQGSFVANLRWPAGTLIVGAVGSNATNESNSPPGTIKVQWTDPLRSDAGRMSVLLAAVHPAGELREYSFQLGPKSTVGRAELSISYRGTAPLSIKRLSLTAVYSDLPTGDGPAPELIEVRELNPGSYPWLSEDGLTVHWERSDMIWTATRADAQSYFADKKEILPGRQPTLTADGLQIVFLGRGGDGKSESLFVAKRENLRQPFRRGIAVRELADQPEPKSPSLSPDGLTLWFSRGGTEIVACVRKDKASPWSKPKPLPVVNSGISGFLYWPYLDEGGLTMYCANAGGGALLRGGGNLMVFSRATASKPFAAPRAIEVDGLPPLVGRSPRYVAATRELFFTRAVPENGKPNWIGIWVVKNFTPPH